VRDKMCHNRAKSPGAIKGARRSLSCSDSFPYDERVTETVVVREWDADQFHKRVLELENQGYISRRETYRITAEMNPETGIVTHLHSIELYRAAKS